MPNSRCPTVVLVGALWLVSGCAAAPEPIPETRAIGAPAPMSAEMRQALSQLEVHVEDAQITLKERLGEHVPMQDPLTLELARTNIELAGRYIAAGDIENAAQRYGEGRLFLDQLKNLAPLAGDMDGDGIADATDKCPKKRETRNGWMDEDGCPEDTVYVAVTARNAKGEPVKSHVEFSPNTVVLLNEASPLATVYAAVLPGDYTVTVKGETGGVKPVTFSAPAGSGVVAVGARLE